MGDRRRKTNKMMGNIAKLVLLVLFFATADCWVDFWKAHKVNADKPEQGTNLLSGRSKLSAAFKDARFDGRHLRGNARPLVDLMHRQHPHEEAAEHADHADQHHTQFMSS